MKVWKLSLTCSTTCLLPSGIVLSSLSSSGWTHLLLVQYFHRILNKTANKFVKKRFSSIVPVFRITPQPFIALVQNHWKKQGLVFMTPWKELLKEMGLVINITHSQGLVHEFEVHPGPITSSDRCQSAVKKWKTNLIEKIGTFHDTCQWSFQWRNGKLIWSKRLELSTLHSSCQWSLHRRKGKQMWLELGFPQRLSAQLTKWKQMWSKSRNLAFHDSYQPCPFLSHSPLSSQPTATSNMGM